MAGVLASQNYSLTLFKKFSIIKPQQFVKAHKITSIEAMQREIEIEQMIRKTLLSFSTALKGYKIVLFGSRANLSAKERSDFDIGVLGDSRLPAKVFFAIEDALDQLPTLYKIDWVNLNLVREQFLKHAMEDTRVIYE